MDRESRADRDKMITLDARLRRLLRRFDLVQLVEAAVREDADLAVAAVDPLRLVEHAVELVDDPPGGHARPRRLQAQRGNGVGGVGTHS
jgi:hypothetical protein